MARKSRRKQGPRKNAAPGKPYPEFPLTPHRSGRWRKIYKGKPYWFGRVEDGHADAFKAYEHAWPYIIAGKPVPPMPGGDPSIVADYQTLGDSIDVFLESARDKCSMGEMSPEQLTSYAQTAKLLTKAIDRNRDIDSIGPDDFRIMRRELAKGRKLQTLKNHVTRARTMFNWIAASDMMQAQLVFGPDFTTPKKIHLSKEKANSVDKAYTVAEARKLLKKASGQMRAMLLLALNAGYKNTDLSNLDREDLDFKGKLLDVPRHKTGRPRRAALWPETLEALREVIEAEDKRRAAGGKVDADAVDAVFVTKYGKRWRRFRATDDMRPAGTDAITGEFGKLLTKAGIKRDGRGISGLRHTYRRASDTQADRPAADYAMGHEPEDMRGVYVPPESIEVKRTRAVSRHIRKKLLGK